MRQLSYKQLAPKPQFKEFDMKTLSALILSSMALIATAQAAEPRCEPYRGEVDYACIADNLEAYNSDYYYNLSPEEIDSMLYTCKTTFHDTVVSYAQCCASGRCKAFGRR